MTGVLAVLYLFLPAFVANAVPLLMKDLPGLRHWDTPLHETWFGSHKTYRGFVCGMAAGVLISLLQYALRHEPVLAEITLVHGTLSQSMLVGFLLSSGALAGDATESFVKRRLAIRPGGALPFWDGADYIIGALLFLLPVFVVPLPGVLFLLIAAPVLSLLANCISYRLGLKDVWY